MFIEGCLIKYIDTFDIDITPADIVPENFNSAEAMWDMIQRLQDL